MGSKFEWLANKLSQLGQAPARQLVHGLFDQGSFKELNAFVSAGVVTGYGTINGSIVYVFAQDKDDCGAGMGKAQVAKIAGLYETAVKTGCPIVGVYDSAGARIDEGTEILESYSKLISCIASASGVVPQISVVTGTCAGSSAVAAAGADIVILCEKAELFVTPPFTAKAMGQDAANAGTAKAAAESGVAHILAKDEEEAFEKARLLISLLPLNNLTETNFFGKGINWGEGNVLAAAGENIAAADMAELAKTIMDNNGSLVELQSEYGKGVFTALGTLGGNVTAITATAGSMLKAAESAKLSRFIQLCDAFHIPVITVINTPGFEQSSAAEAAGSIQAAARLAQIYSEATTPKIALIVGNACSMAAVALAQADIRLAWPGAVISPLAPETAVALMYEDRITAEKSRDQVVAEYCKNEAGAEAAASCGYVNAIIRPENTPEELAGVLDLLASKRVNKMPKKRANIPM